MGTRLLHTLLSVRVFAFIIQNAYNSPQQSAYVPFQAFLFGQAGGAGGYGWTDLDEGKNKRYQCMGVAYEWEKEGISLWASSRLVF